MFKEYAVCFKAFLISPIRLINLVFLQKCVTDVSLQFTQNRKLIGFKYSWTKPLVVTWLEFWLLSMTASWLAAPMPASTISQNRNVLHTSTVSLDLIWSLILRSLKLGFFMLRNISYNSIAMLCLTGKFPVETCLVINQSWTMVIFTRPECLHGFYIIHVPHFDRFQTSLLTWWTSSSFTVFPKTKERDSFMKWLRGWC